MIRESGQKDLTAAALAVVLTLSHVFWSFDLSLPPEHVVGGACMSLLFSFFGLRLLFES